MNNDEPKTAPVCQWSARINASVAGSIGARHTERRTYRFESTKADATDRAIKLAYDEGLEHVLVVKLKCLTDFEGN